MSSKYFQIRLALLVILIAGLFAVPVTMVMINKDNASIETSQAIQQNLAAVEVQQVKNTKAAAGQWVVVDCQQRVVSQCPHAIQTAGQTPTYPSNKTTPLYRGSCRDVSIQIDTFCQ